MKRLFLILLAVLALPILPLARITAAENAKPNIVFILADDLGCMDIGAFNPKTFNETPTIDGLAKRGMKFTQAYAACCVCSAMLPMPAEWWLSPVIKAARVGEHIAQVRKLV